MSWSLDKVGKKNYTEHGSSAGGWYRLMFGEMTVCYMESWPFRSCGVGALFEFSGYFSSVLADPKNVDSLLLFLRDFGEAYAPHEWYFVLSGSQMKTEHLAKFIKHPCVKQIDAFSNKAHNSSGMNLFRLSEKKDFKKWEKLHADRMLPAEA